MNAPDVDAIRLSLSSEVAVVCETSGMIRWADESARRLLRVQPPATFSDLAAPGSEAKARNFLEAACAAETGMWELVMRANRNMVVMAWRGAPLSDGTLLVGNLVPNQYSDLQEQMAAVMSDLTVLQRETERRRRQVEDARRARDVFLSTLAHDLKSPLAYLGWHAQSLDRKLRTGKIDPASLAAELDSIRAGTAEAISTIDELYDLTRTAHGTPPVLQRQSVDLVSLVDRLVSARQESLQHTMPFETSVNSLIIEIDTGRLTRAIMNVIDNAVKYSSPGDPVTIRLEQVSRDGVIWATLSVRDRGIGIPEADLPHIFEPYYRGSNVESIVGQGLGLASARGIVEAHGGRLEVRSEPGVGSQISLWLPAPNAETTSSS